MSKYKRIFVDVLSIFSEEEWNTVQGISEISVDRGEEKIEFIFDFLKYPGTIVIKKLFNFHHSQISIRFQSSGFFFDKDTLKEVLIECVSPLLQMNFEFDPPQLSFIADDIDSCEILTKFIGRTKKLMLFILDGMKMNIEINKIFIPVAEIQNKQSLPEGEKLFLFAVEKKTAVSKYNFGFTNWKKFYWLTEGGGFRDKNKDFDLENDLVVNRYYSCNFQILSRPDAFIDGYLNRIQKLEDCEEKFEVDGSDNQIFPICIHTKNSAFDGLYSAEDFVKEASRKGHKYLGITDMSSVQSFAILEKHAKKFGVTPLYGSELELIDDDYDVMVNDPDKWDGHTICVFDIETTGLNVLVDEIIEIAISRYVEGDKICEFNRFIKASKPLKKHIIEITNITDEILSIEGKDLIPVLKEAREFVRGSLLVAHNGISFDLPFLNAKFLENGIDPIDEPLIDSMRFSQSLFVFDKYKSHSLGAVCKKAGVTYDEEKAHRADYDVDILWTVFNEYLVPNLLEKFNLVLEKKNLSNINEVLFNKEVLNCSYGHNVLVYAKNQQGIKSLYEIISIAHRDMYYGKPTISPSLLKKYKDDLVVVSPPLFSGLFDLVLQKKKEEFAKQVSIYDYVIIPPPLHFIHEIDRENFSLEEIQQAIRIFYEWCIEFSKPFMLNECVRYIKKIDYERYLVLIYAKGISGKRHPLYRFKGNFRFPDFSYKNTDQIIHEYEFLGNKDELLKASIENQRKFLSEFSEGIEPVKKTLYAPSIEGCEKMIKKECMKRMKEIYGKKPDFYVLNKYDSEIECIVKNNYSVIYWVSHLLVKESVKNGYLVGSRGSVGSSFVAFLLGISEVNPLPPHYFCRDCSCFELVNDFWESGFDLEEKQCGKCGKYMESDGHNIPFETFLGFEGNKVPDIDLNFSGKYQNSAHNFLKKFFGKEKVFRAGTISTTAEKSAFGLVKSYMEEIQEKDKSEGKNITKFSQGKTKWLVQQIIDVKRTTGQHPGGILVVPQEYSIYDFTPVNFPANDINSDWLTTHFEFEYLHDSLLKFDILGHDDPTTLALLKELTGVDPMEIPNFDSQVLKLYRSCEVLGIRPGELVNEDNTGAIGLPEFGTLLTRKILETCQPKSFADLIRISGFSHGTGVWKKNIDSLVKSGHKLNEVITCRDDIMIYLMAKGLNREDSFKITEGIRKGNGITSENIELLKAHNVPDWYIESAKKISYIFPKAHATAYVIMSWRIAYYKLYYPLAFYAVYFTICHQTFDWDLLRTNNFEMIKNKYKDIQKRVKSKNWKEKSSVTNKEKLSLTVCEVALEFLKRGFKFQDIDVNKSSFDRFLVDKESNSVIIPFIVVDGLGEIKAEVIEKERNINGEYTSFQDLIERTSINKKVVETFRNKRIIPDSWIV